MRFSRWRTVPDGGRWLARWALIGVAFLTVPAAAAAQGRDGESGRPLRPLELLTEQQEALGLTGDQRQQLAAIQARLAAVNEPLLGRMLVLRREWRQARAAGRPPEDPATIERIRTDAEQIRLTIRRNNVQAMQAVRRLLTPAQRARLRAIVEQRRREAGEREAADVGSSG